jgi:hypothetical protein
MPKEIGSFSGQVVAIDRFEEVSGLALSGSGSIWTDVHREMWIRPWSGVERRFIFTNATVPARKGHRVTLLLGDGRPLALVNFSTEQYVNLVTPRQFELFGAAEAFGFAGLLIAAGLAGSGGLLALLTSTLAYAAIKWLTRQQRYAETWSDVEAEIHRAIARPSVALADEGSQRSAS